MSEIYLQYHLEKTHFRDETKTGEGNAESDIAGTSTASDDTGGQDIGGDIILVDIVGTSDGGAGRSADRQGGGDIILVDIVGTSAATDGARGATIRTSSDLSITDSHLSLNATGTDGDGKAIAGWGIGGIESDDGQIGGGEIILVDIVGFTAEGEDQASFAGFDSFIYTCVDDGTTSMPRDGGEYDPIADMLTRHENVSQDPVGNDQGGGGDFILVQLYPPLITSSVDGLMLA